METSSTLSIISTVVSIIAIALFLWAEILRRPHLDVGPQNDSPATGDDHIYLHLNVKNRKPPWVFSRDLAVDCAAFVSYLDTETRVPLVGEITAKWASRPNPVVPINHDIMFAEWLIPTATRLNVGFVAEKIDVFIKFAGDGSCYAANPWKVFGFPRNHPEYASLRLPKNECIVHVELEAANLGRRVICELRFKNSGPGLADYSWEPMDRSHRSGGLDMTRSQRVLLGVATAFSLVWALILSTDQGTWTASSLSAGTRIGLALFLFSVGFFSAYKALGR